MLLALSLLYQGSHPVIPDAGLGGTVVAQRFSGTIHEDHYGGKEVLIP